jgi:serine/threonine-protein kinase OSR1/STK39
MKVMLLKLTTEPPPLSEEYCPDQTVQYSAAFKQFVDVCLRSNPSERPPAAKLLRHPFFKQVKRKDPIGGNGYAMLPNMLHPIQPMDPALIDSETPSYTSEVTEQVQKLSLNETEWT